jgi:hypothetical protein
VPDLQDATYPEHGNVEVTLRIDNDIITIGDNILDYIHRSCKVMFADLSIW